MKKTTRFLLFLLLVLSIFTLSCGGNREEEIIPHLEVECETCEIIDNKLELEFGDIIYLNVSYYSNEYKDGTKENITVTKSNNDEVILLDGFKVIALGCGEDYIDIKYSKGEEESSSHIVVNVSERQFDVERIAITSKNVINVDDFFEITLNTFGATKEEELVYESSDESVATVDSDGFVSGIKKGVATITVYLKNNPEIKSSMMLNVIEVGEVTTTGDANYVVQEASSCLTLPYGVKYEKLKALTSTPLEGEDADGYSGITAPLIPNRYYPQQISVLEVPNSGDVKVTSWANLAGSRWTLTTVRGLILNYEKNNPGWKVVAAINGDFFDINANGNLPYQTSSVVISNGNYYKVTGGGSVAFPNDGTDVLGNKAIVKSKNMHLDVLDDEGNVVKSFEVEKLNEAPDENESAVYFACYNDEKQIEAFDLEVEGGLFFVSAAELALPNNTKDFYGRGKITTTGGKVNINKGNFAIVSNNKEIKDYLKEGMRIRIQYVLEGDYTGIGDITGCGGTILAGGEYNPGGAIDNRAPRTVIGSTSDGRIIMMVIDGRQGNKNMYGADARELAAIMKSYGCVEAFNLDGGGSSTLVIRQNGTFVVTNSPSDGRERSDANCVLIVVRDIDFDVSVSNVTKTSAKLNVKVNETFGKEVKKLYALIDGTYYEIKDGSVELTGLVHNSTYNYVLCYENNKGEIVETLTGGEIKTEKDLYTYLATFVYEEEETITIEVRYLDTDKSATIGGAKIALTSLKDGEEIFNNTFLNGDGKITLKKSIIGDKIINMTISFSYQVDYQNRESVELENVNFIYIDKR